MAQSFIYSISAVLLNRLISGTFVFRKIRLVDISAFSSSQCNSLGRNVIYLEKRPEGVFECQFLESFYSSGQDIPEHSEIT